MAVKDFKLDNSKPKEVPVEPKKVEDVKTFCSNYGKRCLGDYCLIEKNPKACMFLV